MKRFCLRTPFWVLATTLLVTCFLLGMKLADPPGQQMQTFANAFLETLSEEQIAQTTVAYESSERTDWHFIPMKTRKGLPLMEMNTAQRTAALRLLRSALSEAGYRKASQIMLLEDVLRQLEGPNSESRRNRQKYYVTLFGTPDSVEPWGLSFEGHHLSLNFSCRDGKLVDSSPQFFASNPATIMSDVEGPLGKGTRVLRREEDLAFELINSFDETQKSAAIIADDAPRDIRFGGLAQAKVGPPEGLRFGRLTKDQAKRLKQIVSVYTDAVPEQIAKARRDAINTSGWDNIYFAWAGATKPGIGHYYRIQGDEFLIEFVNTQPDSAGNPANHIHCVYRDLTGDFGLPNS
ncbi:hypothetical protein Q31b_48360 [Novipirellula aureliae]|uniref:DUF3500 domain-containing protein n=1 Tax=Novipirellula aureliae TaxID=2527966 RepID=A0A5C6DJY3_9BACT|nr:DUF3500 domain-containing protein [Novipirellula aureliae]TWU36555.1 hypothetical protein Q31b_48360 [Novipirellula aureliae]